MDCISARRWLSLRKNKTNYKYLKTNSSIGNSHVDKLQVSENKDIDRIFARG
jgi:hypothetical protein